MSAASPAVVAQAPATGTLARLGQAGREALVTMLAALATLLSALAIDPEPGPGVLAVVLCLSLSRSQLDRDRRGRLEAALVLPAVGLVAVGIGMLLRHAPWLGAAVFSGGMFLSIWLRRFGPMARRAGSLIALPFVTLLTVPYIPATHSGPVPHVLVPVLVALLALLWVSLLHAAARRLRLLPPATAFDPEDKSTPTTEGTTKPAPTPSSAGALRPIASTRMAIQMAVALAVSFVVGYVFFAEHWGWIVLTAFIVNSGNRGRLDVVHKSALRVLGAAGGTLVALLLDVHMGGHDQTTVALILAAVFLGVWLRPLGYAWWALCVTIALALLQGYTGAAPLRLLWPRLEEIVIGAVIGVAAAWFVLPVRSSATLRRRLADALEALAVALDPATPAPSSARFAGAVAAAEQLAPAFRASRLLTRRFRKEQPADWLDALADCRAPAIALIDRGDKPGQVRRVLGAARKSLREPTEILGALHGLREALLQAASSPPRSGSDGASIPRPATEGDASP